MKRAIAALAALAALAPAAHAQSGGPLLTAGVDVVSATLDGAVYELRVVNHGDTSATGVVVASAVPDNLAFGSSDPAPDQACAAPASECRWNVGVVPAGAARVIRATYAFGPATSFAVSLTAGVTATGGLTATETDGSLNRRSYAASHDATVDGAALPNTNHGACDELRVGGAATAFVQSDTAPELANASQLVAVRAAELSARVKTAGPGASIAAHRVHTGEWDEGTGVCAGTPGTGKQARTGDAPASEDAAAAVRPATTAGARMTWDVLGALDTRLERVGFQGFELRPAGGIATLDSDEATEATSRPRLDVVYTSKDLTWCVDVTPEDPSVRSDGVSRLTAYVTDGAAKVKGAGTEGCPGTPVAGQEVQWLLEDDAPDAFFSALGATATTPQLAPGGSAGPNSGATLTVADGRTSVELRLGSPYASGQNSGAGRVGAWLPVGPYNVLEPDEPACTPPLDTCPGESGNGEDDVRPAWTPAPAPAPAGGATAPADAAGGGAVTRVARSGAAGRSATLIASSAAAGVGRTVRLSGRLAAASALCAGGEYVSIMRRRRGQRALTEYASVVTRPDGRFELPLLVDASADYVAVAPQREGCDRAQSTATGVAARGRVTVTAGLAAIRGQVLPAVAGRAVLERRAGRRWVAVARATLRRGTFRFSAIGKRAGRYRVRSVAAAGAEPTATSRVFTVG